MKLTYRGANYEYDIPTVDMEEGDVAGKYRGQNWNYRYPRHMKVPKHVQDLQYRGVLECDRKSLKIDRDVTPRLDSAGAAVAQKVEEVATVHRVNICNILDRRKQVARAKGDVKLMCLLELESKEMAC
jgi:hypothetical protein